MKKQTFTVTAQDIVDLETVVKNTGPRKSEHVRRELDDRFRNLKVRR
jgi:hypothetical protein